MRNRILWVSVVAFACIAVLAVWSTRLRPVHANHPINVRGQLSTSTSVSAQISNQTDAPFQIQDAECVPAPPSFVAGSWMCQATLQFTDARQDWNAYGLKWTETWENGTKSTLHTGADAGLPPTGNPFRAGDTVKTNTSAGGGHAGGMEDAQHNPLRLASVEVQPEFAISVAGKPWGDTNSKFYEAMMNTRSGYYMAMDRLKKVYATQGSAGVQNVLKQPH